jgi:hypothetical protein
MKKQLLALAGLILLGQAYTINAQKLVPNSHITGISYAGDKVKRIYIPPPKEFYRKSEIKGGADITVYFNGFAPLPKTAVEFAVSILESILPEDVHFTILANWTKLSSTSVLANSSTTAIAGGWSVDALNPFAYYPVALAEKIAGETLNEDPDGDIILNINSSVSWYYSIDGNTPYNKFDLVTVVLHEIMHGLGFFSSLAADFTSGSYGYNGIPVIYDTFIENGTGDNLTDTLVFDNPSAALRTAVTGGNLWFRGPLVSAYPGGRGEIYAPSVFDEGSSISHLSEDIAPVDGLMTPFIDRGEAIHSPGALILSMLADMGWVNTRIKHTPPGDTEENLADVHISAEIFSDTLFNRNKVAMVWSSDNFLTQDTIYLTEPASGNTFSIDFPIPHYNSEIEYYLSVEDTFKRIYRSPSYIKVYHHSFYIGVDTVKPDISHSFIDYLLESADTISFNAVVKDNIEVDSVYIEYIVNDGLPQYIGLSRDSLNHYSSFLIPEELSMTGGDSLLYRIIAFDKANIPNYDTLPRMGYQKLQFENLNTVADSYTTDFSDAGDDFFNIGFEITQPSAFTSPALHTRHPYESPEEDGDSINSISILRTPVVFDTTGMIIRFMEVVLVEPGEVGSLFGSEDFYDYVIVEGSKNLGKTWFPLADGYDSRYLSAWAGFYNSAIVGNNSTYVGTESIMMKHTFKIDESSFISGGDTLLVRFRLFSDPYANGWGWVIEDLHIGSLISTVNDADYNPFTLFPNPGNGVVNIRNATLSDGRAFKYSVFNATGTLVASGTTTGNNEEMIDISLLPSGIYFLQFHLPNGYRTVKYSLIK